MDQPRQKEKLLVLSHFYEPEPNFVTADVAARLARDYDVTAVVPHPNYPLNRVYPGTRWWRPVRTMERGVTVWRLPVIPYHGLSHIGRAISYASFAVPATLLAPLLAGRARVVWVYLGPFSAALAAIPYRLFARARIVFTCADLWPESLLAAGVAKPGWKVQALFAYGRAINRMADAIICATRGTLERFAADGISRDRLHFVPVWVRGLSDLARSAPPPASEAAGAAREEVPRASRSIVYAGNLGPAQGLDAVILAARQLEQENVAVTFEFYGTGSDEARLRRMAAEQRLSNVRFHGRIPLAESFALSAAALAQIICLAPSPFFDMTIPSKLSFCCAAGSPLLYGLRGEAARIAAATGGGFAFDPARPSSLADAVKQLLQCSEVERRRMSARLRTYYRDHFEAARLLERYRAIVAGDADTLREPIWPVSGNSVGA